MTEILLLPFNGQLNIRNTYNWNRSQVYNFLQGVVDNHADYNVLADRVAELMSIMRSGVIWRRLCDPCRNCSEMIRLYGRNIENFGKDTESAEASP